MLNIKHVYELLLELKSLLTNHQDQVLPFKEACKYTDLSPSQLYKLTSQAKIPHSKPNGKKVYFSKVDLDAWLMRNKINLTSQVI